MNKLFFFLLLAFSCLQICCKKEVDKIPPTIKILSPTTGSTFMVSKEISIKAELLDNNRVSYNEFYIKNNSGKSRYSGFLGSPTLDVKFTPFIDEDLTLTVIAEDPDKNRDSAKVSFKIIK